MARLTLDWPTGKYRIETIPARSGTILTSHDAYDVFVREGPAVKKPVHKCAALYETLVRMSPEKFVNTYGLLWSRGRRETVEEVRLAQREVKKLLAAKKRDDWDAAKKWMQKTPRVIQLDGVIGEDEKTGLPQLEFQPRHLLGFIVAQLIQDWSGGAEYRFCKTPGCPEWFYFGAGTDHRMTAEYHNKKCNLAHAYQRRKGQSK